MNTEKKMVSYMEEKYGETFTYIGPKGGQLGSTTAKAWVKCERFPEAKILVASYEKAGRNVVYDDNYMAFLLHEDAYEAIDAIVRQVFSDYQLFFSVPDATFEADPASYGLEDYLEDTHTDLAITLISFSEKEEGQLEQLAKAFGEQHIGIKGLLFYAGADADRNLITEENRAVYEAKDDWHRVGVNFRFESDGTISYESWR